MIPWPHEAKGDVRLEPARANRAHLHVRARHVAPGVAGGLAVFEDYSC